jgi:putative ABC transport system permease protein
MLRWTLKSLIHERVAFFIGVAAASSALLLVMFFEAVYAGEADNIIAYPRNAGADVWVMQRGVGNMHMATSYLSDWKVSEVRNVPGVASVEPILYLNTVIEAGGQQWFAYIVGLDTPADAAGPWAMHSGKRNPDIGETVVPEVFARVTGLRIGSPIRIVDHEFTVVGLSRGTFSMANSVIFVTRVDVEDIMTSLDIVSFMLVNAEDGIDATTLASDIEAAVDNVEALTTNEFLANDKQMALQMGVETVALMTIICGALAAFLIAFTVYAQVARQRRELAVAKALGVGNPALYLSVCVQAVLLAAVSTTFAVLMAVTLMPLVTAAIPMVTLQLSTASVARVAMLGFVVAILASILPARRVATVDPMTAFQG